MRKISALTGRGLLALVCSSLVLFQPLLDAQGAVAAAAALPVLSSGAADPAPELIAVAKLSGTADRNGEPLVNGSIIASGDSLRTHGNSALLLASTPEERMWLGPNTDVKLSKDAGNVMVSLARGTLTFRSQGHVQVSIENHDGVALRSRPGAPVLAQLTLVGSQQAQVRVQEGSLELVEGGRTMLLQPEHAGGVSSTGASRMDEPTAKNNAGQAQAAAEATTGAINGTVVDTGLFVVSGASVGVTSATGKALTTITGPDGKFAFNDLPAGTYTLRVTKSKFKPYELKDVVVRGGNESSLFVHLGTGSLAGGSNNHVLLWVLIGGGAAAGIGAALAARGGSSNNTSPSTVQ